jgi:predicted nuclease with TOPRIM domain
MSTKQKILDWHDDIIYAKKHTFKSLLDEKDKNSQKVTNAFEKLKTVDAESSEFSIYSEQIDRLNQRNKELESKYQTDMKKKFKEFHRKYENIYTMMVNGTIDEETLTHVLNMYDRVENGHIDKKAGMNQGMDFMTQKYKLPKDFFNRDAV